MTGSITDEASGKGYAIPHRPITIEGVVYLIPSIVAEEIKRLQEAIRTADMCHDDEDLYCPFCTGEENWDGYSKVIDHADDCIYAALIAKAEEA